MDTSPLRIMIVEDDLLLAQDLKEKLMLMGYQVTSINKNSDQAIASFQKDEPDLVLCDIHLKGSKKDGIDTAIDLNTYGQTPIVFLTSFGDAETVKRAEAAAPANYLIKPCGDLQLKIALGYALSNFYGDKKPEYTESIRNLELPEQTITTNKKFFFIRQKECYQRVDKEQIVYVKSDHNKVDIVTSEQRISFSVNLSSFLRKVNHPAFVRVHRQYVINFEKIQSYDFDHVYLEMPDKLKPIPIGKTFRDDLLGRLPRLGAD